MVGNRAENGVSEGGSPWLSCLAVSETFQTAPWSK